MALSQDEQRMLAEIERRLASDDPSLASCLTTFRRPGPATVLRSPRARIIGSLFTVLLVAMVSMMVYAMVPFRHVVPRHSPPTASAPGSTSISAVANDQPNPAQPSKSTTTSASNTARSTATGNAQQAKTKPTGAPQLMPEADKTSP